MIAFVLSGAGNRGPLQVGALRALLEQGIRPDLLVGTSAGAINALFLAAHGLDAPHVTEQMATMWSTVTATTIYPGNLFQIGWRLWNKEESLYPSTGVRKMLEAAMPPGVATFADLKCPLFVTTTDLTSLQLFLFGEDPSAPLIDAVLASATVPVIHPPLLYQGLQLVDGSTVANVAAGVAMDQGATELYVINAGYDDRKQPPVDGIVELLTRLLATVMTQTLLIDLDRATKDTAVDLHPIQVIFSQRVSFRDFSKTDAMVQEGYAQTKRYLTTPQPRTVAPAGRQSIYGEAVGAAREYIPPYRR